MEYSKEIIDSLNKPLIPHNPSSFSHKIFIKYTSAPYLKYAFELLDTLCRKTSYNNKKHLLHLALSYLLIILYNCGNNPYLSNFDIMILCCFGISIKSLENQKQIPPISKLKTIYEEKYLEYSNIELVKAEIICLKLINYNINIFTYYDCLCYLMQKGFKDKEKIFDLVTKELEKQILNNINDNIKKKPLLLAKESIDIVNNKISINCPKLFTRKIVPMFRHIKIQNNNKNLISDKIMHCNINTNNKNDYLNNSLNAQKKKIINSVIIDNSITHSNINTEYVNKYTNLKSNQNNEKYNLYKRQISFANNSRCCMERSDSKIDDDYCAKSRPKKHLTRNLVINNNSLVSSFSNLEIADYNNNNNSSNKNIIADVNYGLASPNGKISTLVLKNDFGINMVKNSSAGNIFKKPCLNKNYTKICFNKKKKRENYKENVFNNSNEYISGSKSKYSNNDSNNSNYTNPFCIYKVDKYNGNSQRIINTYI